MSRCHWPCCGVKVARYSAGGVLYCAKHAKVHWSAGAKKMSIQELIEKWEAKKERQYDDDPPELYAIDLILEFVADLKSVT
jgi:hypothetical protein